MANEPGKTIEETVKELETKKDEETAHLKRRHKWHKIRHGKAVSEHKKVPWERLGF